MRETKVCRSCNQELPLTKFKPRSNRGRQAGQRNSQCNRCLYVKHTRPRVDERNAKIAAYKLERGCADCGYSAHPAALEFDHLPGSMKKFNIGGKVASYSEKTLWEEIAKCDVVCANCHNIRTAERRTRVEIEAVA